MATQVTVFQPVEGNPMVVQELFLADPTWLPEGEEPEPGHWTMSVRGVGVRWRVTARIAPARTTGQTIWRSLSWDPVERRAGNEGTGFSARLADRLLPSFEGELGLHATGGATSLVLDGHYEPPGGRLGAALDDAALHHLAEGTARRLLADVAARLAAGASEVEALADRSVGVEDAAPEEPVDDDR